MVSIKFIHLCHIIFYMLIDLYVRYIYLMIDLIMVWYDLIIVIYYF